MVTLFYSRRKEKLELRKRKEETTIEENNKENETQEKDEIKSGGKYLLKVYTYVYIYKITINNKKEIKKGLIKINVVYMKKEIELFKDLFQILSPLTIRLQ